MRVAAMRTMLAVGAGLAALALGTGAAAPPAPDVTVTFVDDVPTDSFRIANTSLCDATITAVTIDLAGSAGGLVFDTEAGGAGVNAFQPFGVRSGAAVVARASPVSDGDNVLTLAFSALVPGAAVEVTIDVDDRLVESPLGQALVSGSEISGAVVTATITWATGERQTASGIFGPDAVARVTARSCAKS